jgi:PA14 domain/Dolichyl-phosphate-mannose-protein mannosyltransferase
MALTALGRLPIAWLVACAAATFGIRAGLEIVAPAAGLSGRYFDNAQWLGQPAFARVERTIDVHRLADRWIPANAQVFSVHWSGNLLVSSTGSYTFATRSDDGSWLYIDGRLVVDNGGAHGPLLQRGSTTVDAGLHRIDIRYFQRGGGYELDVMWSPSGRPLRWLADGPIVAGARSAGPARLRLAMDAATPWLVWGWCLAVVAVLTALALRIARRYVPGAADPAPTGLKAVLVLTFGLAIWGLDWGVPAMYGWAPDELIGLDALDGLERRFSGGWYTAYPPLHQYVLALVQLPLLVVERLGWMERLSPGGLLASQLASRSVSVVMAVGTIHVLFLLGRQFVAPGAAALGALAAAVLMPFVFYAKLANVDVPYMLWVLLAFVFLVELTRSDSISSHVGLAVAAALAICTKDQAYGYFVALPPALVVRRWYRLGGVPGRWRRSLFDPGLWTAGLVNVLSFAIIHNFAFNFSGFIGHITQVAGPGAAPYRMFDVTPAGHLALAIKSIELLAWSASWPLLIVGLAGAVLLVRSAGSRPAICWLLLAVLSYQLTLVHVVGFVYDRFLLGASLILALCAGPVLAAMIEGRSAYARWSRVAAFAILSFALLRAAAVDALMTSDSRYLAERTLHARVGVDQKLGAIGLPYYLPRLWGLRWQRVSATPDAIATSGVTCLVLNEQVRGRAATLEQDAAVRDALRTGSVGYEEVFRYRAPAPFWAPLAWSALAQGKETPYSNLAKINPEIVIACRP